MIVNQIVGALLLLSGALDGEVVVRSNAPAVMVDTLPGPASMSGVIPTDVVFTIKNGDPAQLYQMQADPDVALDGKLGGFKILGPGQTMDVVSDGVGYWTFHGPDRVRFGAFTTLYVSPFGDDTHSCIGVDPALACKTPQLAFDAFFANFDMAAQRFSLQLAYPEDCSTPYVYPGFSIRGSMTGHYGSSTSGSNATFEVDGKVGDDKCAVIDGGAADAVNVLVGKSLHLNWVTLKSTNGNGVSANLPGSEMVLHNVGFGPNGVAHISVANTAVVFGGETVNIYGAARQLVYADAVSRFYMTTGKFDFHNGAYNFADFVLGAARSSNINVGGTLFTNAGSVTGQRWRTLENGSLDTGGLNPDTFIPGSINGANVKGGQTSYP